MTIHIERPKTTSPSSYPHTAKADKPKWKSDLEAAVRRADGELPGFVYGPEFEAALAQAHKAAKTAWERAFVSSIAARHALYGAKLRLTPKQWGILQWLAAPASPEVAHER